MLVNEEEVLDRTNLKNGFQSHFSDPRLWKQHVKKKKVGPIMFSLVCM